MVNRSEAGKIMTKPLPEILDEIEDSIRLADEAAKNAREAAVQVRKAGDKAVSEASKIANERIAEVDRMANKRIAEVDRITNERIDRVEQVAKNAMQLAELLKLSVMDGVAAVDKRLSEKAPDIENAPKK